MVVLEVFISIDNVTQDSLLALVQEGEEVHGLLNTGLALGDLVPWDGKDLNVVCDPDSLHVPQLKDVCFQEGLLDAVAGQHFVLLYCGKLCYINKAEALGPLVWVLERLSIQEASCPKHQVSEQE